MKNYVVVLNKKEFLTLKSMVVALAATLPASSELTSDQLKMLQSTKSIATKIDELDRLDMLDRLNRMEGQDEQDELGVLGKIIQDKLKM